MSTFEEALMLEVLYQAWLKYWWVQDNLGVRHYWYTRRFTE
jgi:hypothetical protein